MKINQSKLQSMILGLMIALSGCLGSLYYLLSGYSQLMMVMLIGLMVIFPFLGKGHFKIIKKEFLLCSIICLMILSGDRSFRSLGLPATLLMVTMIMLSCMSQYLDEKWMDYTMTAMKVIYFFHATYTILEKFYEPLFLYSVALFPSSYETLLSQYSAGCMPGLTNHYSTNGMLLGVGILLFGAEAICERNKKNKFLLIYIIIAVLLTGKRSDILFTVSGLYFAFYCYMSNNRNKRISRTLAIVGVALIGLVFIINFVPSLATFITRFEETKSSGDVTLGRTKMWAIAFDEFKKHPIRGVGFTQFRYINLHEWNAHNIYLQLMAEVGLIGFLIFVLYFLSNLVRAWLKLKKVRRNGTSTKRQEVHLCFSIAMQIFFILYGITGNPLYDKEVYVAYYFACAIITYYLHTKQTNGV